MITSTNCRDNILDSNLSSSFLLNAIIPPNAEVGSVLYALLYASLIFLPSATPQGLACFTITHAGFLNCFTQESALSESTILLYDSSLPET